MATIEKIQRENLSDENVRLKSAMPSRAKYFYNTETEIEKPVFKNTSTLRYGDFTTQKSEIDSLSEVNIKNEDLKRDISAGNPDILPTNSTLKMLKNGNVPSKPFDNAASVSYRVNAKGKLLFALYAVLVLSLVLVIVLNALAIERQKSANLGIENQISLMSATVEDLQTNTESLNNNLYMQSQAEDLGMTELKVTYIKVKAPELVNKTEIVPATNWFDWLCDIFS